MTSQDTLNQSRDNYPGNEYFS